jgi:uncharacterized protein YecE (DUF72 family)
LTRIGPAGWAYKDWGGIVYPQHKARGFHPASFLAEFFDTIEINVSFYRPITAKTGEDWLKRIESNRAFRFTAKLWRGFTHERDATAKDEREFKDGFAPLLEAGRLGALLLQFPTSFKNTPETRVYVAKLHERFSEFPLVLEVRHASWSEAGVLDFLYEMQMGFCNIDQPLLGKALKPSAISTSTTGYVRLHGRNYKSWFTENRFAGERYDYLYRPEELDPWVARIKAVEESADDTYVVTNNHYLGKAVVNATEISSILKGKRVSAPASLVEHYPELKDFTLPASGQASLEL